VARGLLFLAGLALVVAGVGLVYVPAALVVGGLGVMGGAWLDQRAALREASE
jgi:hypothetical protein